jgi:hypothetical protein
MNVRKIRCSGELRDLYGLKQRQNPQNEFGQFRKVSDSVKSSDATDFMTHAETAKEVGFKEKRERVFQFPDSLSIFRGVALWLR